MCEHSRFTVETRGFSFAYLKEVFVSTLLLIAGGEKMPFSQLLLAQAHACEYSRLHSCILLI